MPHGNPAIVAQPLTDLLLNTLEANAGDHEKAEYLIRYDNPTKPPSAVTGGTLCAIDPATGWGGWQREFQIRISDQYVASQTVGDVTRRSLDAGTPIRTLHYAFERDAAGRWQHRLAVETAADWKALRAELRQPRRRIEAALTPLLTDHRTDIYLRRQVNPPKPDVLNVRVDGASQAHEPTPAVQSWLDDFASLLDARRRVLVAVTVTVKGEHDDWKSDLDMFYRLRPDLT